MNWIEFCSVIGVSAILSSIINIIFGYFEKKNMLKFESISQEKAHRYQATLAFMLIVLDTNNISHVDISGVKNEAVRKMNKEEIKAFFLEEVKAHYCFSHLYASNDVLESLKLFIDNPTTDSYQRTALYMRKDVWE